MAEKIWYGKALAYFWNKYHIYYEKEKLDPQGVYIKMKKDVINPSGRDLTEDMKQAELLGTELWYSDFIGETTHLFFVDRELRDFLSSTKLSDLQGVKEYLKVRGKETQVVITSTKEREQILMFSFSIHLPFEEDAYAFQLGIDSANQLTLLFCRGDRLSTIPERLYPELEKSSEEINAVNAEIFRLAINILAYLNCFPECIKDGVPPHEVNNYEARPSKIIGTSTRVIEAITSEEIGHQTIPHFRKGHFRLLKSEYFKNKQGQLVFVHQTMVNGIAKTVYTSENLELFE